MTVVVGVDGSAGSYAAIRLAAQEARYRAVPLLAVMAYSSETALGAPGGRPLSAMRPADDERIAADARLRDVVRGALGAQAGNVSYRTEAGLPGRVLVATARSASAQLMVLHARGDPAARVLGAVSQHVLRNAPCPVLVVPDGGKNP